jgi:hypothetical protein
MRRLLVLPLLLVAVPLVLAPQAFAKGPVVLCGPSACAPLLDEGPGLTLLFSATSQTQVAVPSPSPYFAVKFRDLGEPLAYWVPAAGALRFTSGSGTSPTWVRPQPELAGLLSAAAAGTAGLVPYQPSVDWVVVGAKDVSRPSSYVRLYTIGTPTTARPNRHAWVRIWISIGLSPWADGDTALMWISRSGPYLLRQGQVLEIPQGIAVQIRHGRPLR